MPDEATVEASPLEQFMAVANQLGGLDDGHAAPEAPATPAKEEPATAPAKQPAIAAAVDDGEAAKEAEKAKQGAPKPADWAAIREEKRKFRAWQETESQRLAGERAKFEADRKAAEATSPERIQELIDAGNFDEVAKAFGCTSWEDLNTKAARAFASPEFRRIRELEAAQAKLEAERAEEKREREAAQAEYQRQQAEREFVTFVDTECKAATDPVVKALATAPEFTQAVYGHLVQHYRETGEQMDVAEAAQVIADGARRRYAEWHKVFGSQPTDNQAEAAQAVTPDRAGSKQPARPTKHVARNRAAEAASPTRELTHQEQIATWKGELEKALAKDLAEGTFG